MNKLVIITAFFMFLLINCWKTNTVENKIVQSIEHQSVSKNECKIAIKDVTKFKWDKLYVFDYSISMETVEDAIKMNYPQYEENTRPFIFIKGNEIVYYENNTSGTEHLLNQQIVFDFPDSLKYMVYTPDNAVFKIEKESFDEGQYYLLHQINR